VTPPTATGTSNPSGSFSTVGALPSGGSSPPAATGAGSSPGSASPPVIPTAGSGSATKPPAPLPGSGSAVVAPPPPRVTPPPAPTAPKVIPPNQVKRTSGELPKINTYDRFGDNQPPPSSVVAKICIDTSGNVTSVNILKLSGDLATKLQAAVKTFKFTPYKEAGKALPACFINTFALAK
jgi:hypothetical protein